MSCVGTNFNLILIILTNFIEKHTRSPSKNVLTKVAEKASLGVINITSIGQELMKAKIFQKSKLVFTVREKYRASVFKSTVLWKKKCFVLLEVLWKKKTTRNQKQQQKPLFPL